MRSLFACLVGPFFPQPTDIFDKVESNWKRITLWKWSKQCDEYVLVQFILVSDITNVISFVTFYHKLGELSNDDGDGNENGKKPVGLDWQNNNFARASRFLYSPTSISGHPQDFENWPLNRGWPLNGGTI